MEITIKIDEKTITELVEVELVKKIMQDSSWQGREAKFGVRNGMDKAVKQYIYENKECIIERVVDRASREVVKKGLPKLIEKLK